MDYSQSSEESWEDDFHQAEKEYYINKYIQKHGEMSENEVELLTNFTSNIVYEEYNISSEDSEEWYREHTELHRTHLYTPEGYKLELVAGRGKVDKYKDDCIIGPALHIDILAKGRHKTYEDFFPPLNGTPFDPDKIVKGRGENWALDNFLPRPYMEEIPLESDDSDYEKPDEPYYEVFVKIPYTGNGFVMYTNVYFNKTNTSDKKVLLEKQNNIKSKLTKYIENVFIDETYTFNHVCDIHFPLAKKLLPPTIPEHKSLLDCAKYASEQGLDLIVWRVQDITYNIELLGDFLIKLTKKNLRMYVINKTTIVNLEEFLTGDFQEKMLQIEKKCTLDFQSKSSTTEVANISKQKGDTKSKDKYEILMDKAAGKKWKEIFGFYEETGINTWICNRTGGSDDIDSKRWKDKYKITVLELLKELIETMPFPVWNKKVSLTNSLIIKIKRNCNHPKAQDIFAAMDPPVIKDSKILPEDFETIPESRRNRFSEFYKEDDRIYTWKKEGKQKITRTYKAVNGALEFIEEVIQ